MLPDPVIVGLVGLLVIGLAFIFIAAKTYENQRPERSKDAIIRFIPPKQ